MRIQHNITAMNSYRNYAANTKAVSKNLEKLSSGYRINRAGDDAAGLAISEKMRAQITGLKTAQKNAKDGISLIQTAEGALTEVHSMLNRMFELSEQSANGTYDNEVDRANLQKEVSALKTEMDRIADSSNFNGIKLLDGSLGGSAASSTTNGVTLEATKALSTTSGFYTYTTANKSVSTISAADGAGGQAYATGDTIDFSFTIDNGDGTSSLHKISLVAKDATTLVSADGEEYTVTDGDAFKHEFGNILESEFGKISAVKDQFSIVNTAGSLALTSKVAGTNAPTISMVSTKFSDTAGFGADVTAATVTPTTAGSDAYETIDISTIAAYDAAGSTDINDSVFSVNGVQIGFAKDAASAKALVDKFGSEINVIIDASGNTTLAAADTTAALNILNSKAGLSAVQSDSATNATNATGTFIQLKPSTTTTPSTNGKGLTLQIGDTAESFNQLNVNVGDMHTKALGINGVDIGTQAGASAAMEKIKTAINSVSSTRGDLGALQNRLDHTINNLAVMTENIQDAEATVRDTDVAEEMMAYTKNNILVQSAQAMLAQANQLPQGVLQLLG